MPTNPVSADQMAVGKKSGGKHWTAAEVESRQKAAEGMKRKTKVSLRAPDWLSDEAKKVWARVRKQSAGLDILDNLDCEMLAIYCDAVVNYRLTAKKLVIEDDNGDMLSKEEAIKLAQSWARVVAAYSDKLGLSPAARARLAKKKADDNLDDFESEFGG